MLSGRDLNHLKEAQELARAIYGLHWDEATSVAERGRTLEQLLIAVRLDAIAAAIHANG